MKLNAPKFVTWVIAVVFGVLGIAGHFVAIPFVSEYSFWLETVGFVILALSTFLKGL